MIGYEKKIKVKRVNAFTDSLDGGITLLVLYCFH